MFSYQNRIAVTFGRNTDLTSLHSRPHDETIDRSDRFQFGHVLLRLIPLQQEEAVHAKGPQRKKYKQQGGISTVKDQPCNECPALEASGLPPKQRKNTAAKKVAPAIQRSRVSGS